jgi:hypothetical protein
VRIIRLAFYKASHGTFVDKLISFVSRGEYSHVELIFEDMRSFSSSPRDDGTRFAVLQYDLGKWDFVDIHVTDQQYTSILNYCKKNAGKKYDWMGVFSFVLPLRQDRKRFYCTEVIVLAFQAASLWLNCNPSRISPIQLYRYIVKWMVDKFESNESRK